MMTEFTLPQLVAIWALPLLFAITLHEVAHGWAALKLGDSTAKMMGRLSLNPIKHVDPIGTIVVPIALLALSNLFGGGFIFGWAKPVPVNWGNLRNPRRDIALVALAGPGANLLMALAWALLAKIGLQFGDNGIFLYYVGLAGVLINCLLMVLNLLPILPLDGGRVLYTFLPHKLAYAYAKSEPYGFFILLALLATGALGFIMQPFLFGVLNLIEVIMG